MNTYWIGAYFLSMKVWQKSEGTFLNQGKYVVEILKIFDMLECKAMATPMDSNLKLLADDSLELVDAVLQTSLIYRQHRDISRC